MSGGSTNIEGIRYQVESAFSLFLQYLKDDTFLEIHLEAPEFQDFNLVFINGKKIICECKNRKGNFNYSHLKTILDKNKNNINDGDEFLIVCRNINRELVGDVENVKYSNVIKEKFKNKSFSEDIIVLLEKVDFWVLPKNFKNEIIYNLMREIIGFWLPAHELEKIANNLIYEKILTGSCKSGIYTRQEFLCELEQLASSVKKDSVYFNDEYKKKNDQFLLLEGALENPDNIAWKSLKELSALSIQMDLMSFVINKLKNKECISLIKWNKIWTMNRYSYFLFGIFDIFMKNIESKENQEFVVNYCKENIKGIIDYYKIGFFTFQVKKILSKIIQNDYEGKYLTDILFITKELIENEMQNVLYLKNKSYGNDLWKKEETCKLLYSIYTHSQADSIIKEEIFNFVVLKFNITCEDGEFNHSNPKQIYDIIYLYLIENFDQRFFKVVKVITDQYDGFFGGLNGKKKFSGWEPYGNWFSHYNNDYKILDRHFIRFILSAAIKKKYNENKEEAWSFIKRNCIIKDTQVNREKPDFLNRAVYKIVLDRYFDENPNISEEAFEILRDYCLSSKGIPNKALLVFSDLYGEDKSVIKMWKLVEGYLKRYETFNNVFLDKIVSNCAANGLNAAKETIKNWYASKEYYQRKGYHFDFSSDIDYFLKHDNTFGIELFKLLVNSEYVCLDKGDEFNMYSIANSLNQILKQNYSEGLSILKSLSFEKKLSNNQQIIYSASLCKVIDNEKADTADFLIKVYVDVVCPFIKSQQNISNIVKRIPNAQCRKMFVILAEKLAAYKYIKEALSIIHIFVNDPDPSIQSNEIENGKTPTDIKFVRGQCAWALMKCIILETRSQISDIIKLISKLIHDENYYVLHMASLPLAKLADLRLRVLPKDNNNLFLHDDLKEALLMAKEIESLAFVLLDRFIEWPFQVQKAMATSIANVFNPIRALNEVDAYKFINTVESIPLEIQSKFVSFFLYYAELRKYSYDDWKFKLTGLYDDLSSKNFHDEKFKDKAMALLKKLQSTNPDYCFEFVANVETLLRNRDDIVKYNIVALKYLNVTAEVYGQSVFNLIYQIIKSILNSEHNLDKEISVEDWFILFIKSLETEKGFFEMFYSRNNTNFKRWGDSIYSELLELIYIKFGEEKFIQAANVFIAFPKEIILNESESLVDIIKNIAQTSVTFKYEAISLVNKLFEKNPAKYFELQKELNQNVS